MEKEQIDVLLIEDDEEDYVLTRRMLEKATSIRCSLTWERGYSNGLDRLLSDKFDVCLIDYRLGKHDGLHLMRNASDEGCRTPMILLTGQGDLEVDLNAMMVGAADYLVKSNIDADLLERSIRYARERHRAQERIQEQAALLDKARDAISAYNMEGEVIYWNRSAERLTGWAKEDLNQIDDASAFDKLYAEDPQAIEQARESVLEEGEWWGEVELQTKDGGTIYVESRWSLVRDASGEPASILVIDTDISERKQLEEQFLRTQRMESIGRLVGGIAHDLGNLLVPILLGVEVLENRLKDDKKSLRTLQMIEKSAERGSDMVKRVLSFARGVEGERVAVGVRDVIKEVEQIALESFPDNIEFITDVPDEVWPILGDATQIQQILVNLCMNARDAMEEGGTLRIEASNVEFAEESTLLSMDAQPGSYVCITVEDTGEGIDPEDIDKVFEPFFTTKSTSEGTGLGLSTVYSIVKSHNGFVDVSSQPGLGTSFAVHLPVATEEELGDTPTMDDLSAPSGECVLVVDDEQFILDTASDMLQRAGYQVLTANEADSALQLLSERGDDIDVVVTDLVMPGMEGLEFVRKIRAQDSELAIVVASSPSDSQLVRSHERGADQFLSKPFTAQKLSMAIRKALSAHSTASPQDSEAK